MPDRQRIALPFGGGIDRATGPAVVQPSSFKDLRNVRIAEGWTSARKGLLRKVADDLVDATHVIGIARVRSQGVSVIITFDEDAGTCAAWLLDGDLETVTLIDTFWTIGGSALVPPIVSLADSSDRLFIAHDEPDFASRQVTQVVDISGFGVADLAPGGSVGSPKFRTIRAHLKYLFGTGWGTTIDQNRPEVVRVSKAGAPLSWDVDDYFVVGQRGDPVLSLDRAGKILNARKQSESYDLIGSSRATFGDLPGDMEFGIAGSQLSVTVGETNYFWSLEGPRSSDGTGRSSDLSTLLALAGPPPSALAANLDYVRGFAVYQPVTREVRFVFGAWAFVLHLADEGRKRWSYAEYAVPLACGGIVADAGQSLGIGDTTFAEMTSVAKIPLVHAIEAEAHITGSLIGGEVSEWWLWSPTTATWSLKATLPANDPDILYVFSGLTLGETYTMAVRLKRSGLASAAYASSDPMDWPASSRLSLTI